MRVDEAARHILGQEGKTVSPRTVLYWIEQGFIPDRRVHQQRRRPHEVNKSDIVSYITGLPYEWVERTDADSGAQVSWLEEQVRELSREVERLREQLREREYRSVDHLTPIAPIRGVSASRTAAAPRDTGDASLIYGEPRRRRAPRTVKLRVKPYRSLRVDWVGRGDHMGYYALFAYVQQAHGVLENTANYRIKSSKDPKRLSAPRWPFTVLKSAARVDEDRNVVTLEQAKEVIALVQAEARRKAATLEIPETAICLDPDCPTCPYLPPGSYQAPSAALALSMDEEVGELDDAGHSIASQDEG
jgi:hypothetical protein